jgi:hypothetical protein
MRRAKLISAELAREREEVRRLEREHADARERSLREDRESLAERQRGAKESVRDADPDSPYDCARHEWRMPRRMIGQPGPRRSVDRHGRDVVQGCPFCGSELERRNPTPPVWEVEHSLNTKNVGRVRELQSAYELKLKRKGVVIPGSEMERTIIREIDERRDEFWYEVHRNRRTREGFAERRRRRRVRI